MFIKKGEKKYEYNGFLKQENLMDKHFNGAQL